MNWKASRAFGILLVLACLQSCSPPQVRTAEPAGPTLSAGSEAPGGLRTPTPVHQAQPSPSPVYRLPPLVLSPITTEDLGQLQEVKMIGDGLFRSVAVSPDGRWIATASTLGVRLHDAGTLAQVLFLSSPRPTTRSTFSGDSSQLAVGGEDGLLRIYSLASPAAGSLEASLQAEIRTGYLPIQALAFSPDGSQVASGSLDRNLVVWETASGKRVRSLSSFSLGVSALAFSPDGTLVAGGSLDGSIHIWRVRTGERLASTGTADQRRTRSEDYPIQLAFPDTAHLLICTADGSLSSWEWQVQASVPALLQEPGSRLADAAYFPGSGRFALASANGKVQVLSPGTPRLDRVELDTGLALLGIALSPGTDQAVLIAYPAGLHLLDLSSGRIRRTFSRLPQGQQVLALGYSPDGLLLASAHGDGRIRVWDAQSMANFLELAVGPPGRSYTIGFSPDRPRLWVAGEQGITAYDSSTFNSVLDSQLGPRLTINSLDPDPVLQIGNGSPVAAFAISPDGKWIAAANRLDKSVSIWSTSTAALRLQLLPLNDFPETLAFSPAGMKLAVGLADHTVREWDLGPLLSGPASTAAEFPNPLLIRNEFAVLSMAFDPAGSRLALAGSYSLGRVVQSDNGGLLFRLRGTKTQLTEVAFSPDGKLLAGGSADGAIFIYQDGKEEPLAVLTGHKGTVNALAFAPNGRLLVSGSDDGTLRLWAVQP